MKRYLCLIGGIHDVPNSRIAGDEIIAPTAAAALNEAARLHGLTSVPPGSTAMAINHHR